MFAKLKRKQLLLQLLFLQKKKTTLSFSQSFCLTNNRNFLLKKFSLHFLAEHLKDN